MPKPYQFRESLRERLDKEAVRFVPIREHYLHGDGAEHQGRRVEVVRAYTSDWRVYAWYRGRAVKAAPEIDSENYATRSAALAVARRYLRSAVQPETH